MRDNDDKMIKKVYYITDKGRTSIYGFRYGKNLSNISRNIVSN
jgi:DNA-binding PadR family transcriptional regulator